MCMELYHGDEDYIEAYNRETLRLKDEAAAEFEFEEHWFMNETKLDNDPAWIK